MQYLASVVFLCLAAGLVGVGIYRLYFHPLAKVPGPLLAALTWAHEFYYDCLVGGGGQHAFKLREMHDRYGPCIRINPNEVHIDGRCSPEYFDVLYSYTNKLDKDMWWYYGFGENVASLSTGPHNLFRIRRSAISPYFSKTNIRNSEPMVLACVEQLCSRLSDCRERGEVVNMSDAWRCLSTDIAAIFITPSKGSPPLLSSPNFSKDFHLVIRDYGMLGVWHRHLRFVFQLLMMIPDWLIEKSGEGGVRLVQFFRDGEHAARIALERRGVVPPDEKPSILDTIVASPELHESDKRFERIVLEARNILGAGTEAPGGVLTNLTYYLAINPEARRRLADELTDASARRDTSASQATLLDVKKLEKLPYLQACISEALRIGIPISTRLPRSDPRRPMTYVSPSGEKYVFPPGTVLSMSCPDLHLDPDVFPEPYSFKPERWLDEDEKKIARMQQSWVPFSRGTRSCIGIDLAKMELLLAVGNVYNRFDFELFETTARDVSFKHDFFAPFKPRDSKGVQVKVR